MDTRVDSRARERTASKEVWVAQDTVDVPVSPRSDLSRVTWVDVVQAYIGMTKPRVIELLLLTTVPVMFFAERGIPPLELVIATIIGGTLSSASASTLNCVYDRDIDEQMRRTRKRALPRHVVSPRRATVFGVILGIAATGVLYWWVNPLSAWLALAAEAFYLLIYTIWLKRRTTQNIVWGGIAGCFPALIGWTAVTNSIALAPLVLFAVVFFWTPPHTWALALRYRDDYAAVSVPMLPVKASAAEVARQIVGYVWAMVAASLGLILVSDTGWLYALLAVALGAMFLREAYLLKQRATTTDELSQVKPMRLFHWSNMYLSLLFVAVAVDAVLAAPPVIP